MHISSSVQTPPLVARWTRAGEPTQTPLAKPDSCPEGSECSDLQREVAELRAEIGKLREEQSPIRLDPQNDRMSIVDLKTPDFHVHDLQVKMSAMSMVFDEHTSLKALLKIGMVRKAEPIDFEELRKQPLEIEKMKISLPGSTLVRSSQQVGGDDFEKHDIKELNIQPRDGDVLKIRGKVDKLIDIPFDIEGKLSVHEGNRIEFALGKTRVFGVIPVFGLVKRIGAAIAGKSMEEMGVERKGTSFIMDADDFLPENAQVRLTKIGTEGDRLVLEGASPGEEHAVPAAERAPSTLTLGIE